MSPDGALVGWIDDKMGFCVSSADGDAPAFSIFSCLCPRDSRDTTGLRSEPKYTKNIHPCPMRCPGALEDIAFIHYQTAIGNKPLLDQGQVIQQCGISLTSAGVFHQPCYPLGANYLQFHYNSCRSSSSSLHLPHPYLSPSQKGAEHVPISFLAPL